MISSPLFILVTKSYRSIISRLLPLVDSLILISVFEILVYWAFIGSTETSSRIFAGSKYIK